MTALPQTSVVFVGLLASLTYVATGCSSGDLNPGPSGEPVAQEQEALDSFCTYDASKPLAGSATRSTEDWWSLGGTNLLPFVDVSTDLACGVSLSTVGQVVCFLPDTYSTIAVAKITNWGGGCAANGSSCTGVPIASSPPRAVAILKHTEKPARLGGSDYGVYVLLADSKVMVTRGESDHFYEGTNFKTYSLFISPVSSTGQSLSFKKIVWINEDGMADLSLTPRLLALTTDNALYYTDYSGAPWKHYIDGVRDMSHLPGRGDTIVFTNGQVHYGAFNPSGTWRGYLPNPSGSSIVAVGGTYALTNDGCHGDCADNISTFCAGDDTRILHFDWPSWKWEPFASRLVLEKSSLADTYYPIGPNYTCPNCSPQIAGSIVDPHGFGANVGPSGSPFNVGPFVNWAGGSRTQYYTPQNGLLPYPFPQCLHSPCTGYCAELLDGTPCPADGPTARVCNWGTCQACGGTSQFPCPGLDCSSVPGGAAAAVINSSGKCVPRSEYFGSWSPVPGGVGTYSAPAVNSRDFRGSLDLYATRIDTGSLHFNFGHASDGINWDWDGWVSLGHPTTGIKGKPSSTTWWNGASRGGAVAIRSQVGAQAQILVKFLNAAGNFGPWTQVSWGDLEQDPAMTFTGSSLYVFAPGTDHQFYFSKNDISGGYDAANWTPWQVIPGGYLTSEGSAVAYEGKLYLAARGTDGLYYLNKSTEGGASWSGWNVVPSSTTFVSGPALFASWSGLDIFGTAAASVDGNQALLNSKSRDFALDFRTTWTPFRSAGGNLTSAPAVTAYGRTLLFARATDGKIWRLGYRD